ncbi:hypothetical protein CYL20_07325 [Pseudomonas palleroniana]|uniref:Phage ABA sandwich domain-containing protein n=1 Tax=Pseudomonas palleroniana TaxID=191390 RepID=A0A2L1J7E0_9PSED|nr:hypothetical protein [Pseudomonas palleroniana]AVE04361.1 hypothetical protein CYL20_07325 [Pseudomonas palleroniana]
MTDQELMVLAAKAAGVDFDGHSFIKRDRYSSNVWEPLHDDGEALRLAVTLGMKIATGVVSCRVAHRQTVIEERYPVDPDNNNVPSLETAMPALRRAIVKIAAEIGKNMPD